MATVPIPEIKADQGFLPPQTKLLLGAFMILAAIGVYAFLNLQSTQQYFLTLAELKAKGNAAYTQSVRVSGELVPNSTKVDSKNIIARFSMTDGSITMPVEYVNGILPDTFEKATQVIAEGRLASDGTFRATLVLAKCPSKYDPSTIEWRTSEQYSSNK